MKKEKKVKKEVRISIDKITVGEILEMAETSIEDLLEDSITQDIWTKLYVRLDGNKVVGACHTHEASSNNWLVADDGTELIEVWGGGSSGSDDGHCDDCCDCEVGTDCDDCDAYAENKSVLQEAISTGLDNIRSALAAGAKKK